MPTEHVGRLAEMMTRRSEMLLRLLEDLTLVHELELGALEVDLQPVDLDELCRDSLVERLPHQKRPVSLDIAPDTVAHTDPLRVTQILDNLVSNALRYGGPNVTLRAAPTRRMGGDRTSRTTARGVPPELEGSMFDAYVRGPESSRARWQRPRAHHRAEPDRGPRRLRGLRRHGRATVHRDPAGCSRCRAATAASGDAEELAQRVDREVDDEQHRHQPHQPVDLADLAADELDHDVGDEARRRYRR